MAHLELECVLLMGPFSLTAVVCQQEAQVRLPAEDLNPCLSVPLHVGPPWIVSQHTEGILRSPK